MQQPQFLPNAKRVLDRFTERLPFDASSLKSVEYQLTPQEQETASSFILEVAPLTLQVDPVITTLPGRIMACVSALRALPIMDTQSGLHRPYKLESIVCFEILGLLVKSLPSTALERVWQDTFAAHAELLTRLWKDAETDTRDTPARFLDFVLCCGMYRTYHTWFPAAKKTTCMMMGSMFEIAPAFYKTGTRQSDAAERRVEVLNAVFGFTFQHRVRVVGAEPKPRKGVRAKAAECRVCRDLHCQPPLVYCGHESPVVTVVDDDATM